MASFSRGECFFKKKHVDSGFTLQTVRMSGGGLPVKFAIAGLVESSRPQHYVSVILIVFCGIFYTVGRLFHCTCVYSLSQWVNIKLSGITCLVGKIKSKLLSQGPLAE